MARSIIHTKGKLYIPSGQFVLYNIINNSFLRTERRYNSNPVDRNYNSGDRMLPNKPRLNIAKWLCPVVVYLAGLAVLVKYALTTNYTLVSDTLREYTIYSAVVGGERWQALTGDYGLQSSCLSTTLFPGLLLRLLGGDPLLLFSLYLCFVIAFLPVVIYFIAKQFLNTPYALLAALFFMGQVVFLQAPSMARTNIAILFFALAILLMLKVEFKWRVFIPVYALLSSLLVVSHYATAYISLLLASAVVVFAGAARIFWQKRVNYLRPLAVFTVCMVVGIVVWFGVFNTTPAQSGIKMLKEVVSLESYIAPITDSVGEEFGFFDLGSRDNIIQVAFGAKDLGEDVEFSFSWGAFVFSWATIILLSYGLLMVVVWKKLPLEYTALAIVSFGFILLTVIVPVLSRAYGIERVFYHSLVFLAPCFIIGCQSVAGTLKVKASWVILSVLLPYLYFIYTYGVIRSITG